MKLCLSGYVPELRESEVEEWPVSDSGRGESVRRGRGKKGMPRGREKRRDAEGHREKGERKLEVEQADNKQKKKSRAFVLSLWFDLHPTISTSHRRKSYRIY